MVHLGRYDGTVLVEGGAEELLPGSLHCSLPRGAARCHRPEVKPVRQGGGAVQISGGLLQSRGLLATTTITTVIHLINTIQVL